MKTLATGFLLAGMSGALMAAEPAQFVAHSKPRLIVLTDLSNEPDDEESLVRLLVYANEFDLEGLVATTSNWLKQNPREDLIRRDLAAYAKVLPNLAKHAPGFPSAEQLLAVTRSGQDGFGLAATGPGRSTGGSRRIIEAVDHADRRPLWISVWGGPNTLAQALLDVRSTRSPADVAKFVAKLRVYAISDQDDTGPWLRHEFPNLFYIVTPSSPTSYEEYYRATWSGISGGQDTQAAPGYHADMVANPWLEAHIIDGHGPLGALYPHRLYLMEGDTPSFLGLIDRGLGSDVSPGFGGWGGRYTLYQPAGETRPIWTDNASTCDRVEVEPKRFENSNQATIWRWREAFQDDFAARMNWCVTPDFRNANHNPRAVLDGDRSTDVLEINAQAGSTVQLSADGTDAGDDGQHATVTWWIYREAGTLDGANLSATTGPITTVTLPAATKPGTVHVILQAEDDGSPQLFSYRRAVIDVTP
ncbi:MAG TPA: nucleoside hydrolase-like domain-containing protein, partial [Opitutus sp.]|nr:nucleoside hydrolase-like domain-containing protein [Opitutus sp.]